MVKQSFELRPGILSAFAGVSSFLSLIQVACLYLGTLQVPMSHPLAVTIVVVSAALSCLFASRFREPAEDSNKPALDVAGPAGISTLIFKGLAVAGVAWAGWTWLRLWILAYQRPPYSWDGLYYHIPAINEWVLMNRIGWIDSLPEVPFVNYPMGVEVLSFFGHYLFKTSSLLNACNLWYWPLAFLATAVIASKLGARGIWRYFAGGLIAGVPVFVCQSLTSYVDLGFAAAVMASIAAALVWVFSKARASDWRAILLGMNVGLMAGAKGTGLPFAFVFLALVIVAVLWFQGLNRWKILLRQVLLCGLVGLAVGGFWYVRNVVKTGNPIYPIQIKLGEKVILEGYDHNLFNQAVLPAWLEKYPPATRMFVSWFQLDAPVSGEAPVGGLGYIWLAGALPAIIFLCILYFRRRTRGSYPAREFIFLLILVLVLLFIQPAAWWSRFTIWLHALGLSCLAAAISLAVARWPAKKRYLPAVVAGLAVAAGAMWESDITLGLERQRGRVSRTDTVHVEYLTSLDYMFPGLGGQEELASFFKTKKIARSPLQGMGSLLVGILTIPLGEREILVLPVPLRELDVDELQEKGIKWVVWDVFDYGPVPEVLSRRARRIIVHSPVSDLNLHFLRL